MRHLENSCGCLRAPAVTGRLETDFLKPVPVGSTLHISAQITGQVRPKGLYIEAIGRLNAPDGEIAVKAAALFIVVSNGSLFE